MKTEEIKKVVRERYGEFAKQGDSCCGPSSCCGSNNPICEQIGYKNSELNSIPESANLGLGCGNPTALAEIKLGEVVCDLGSGAGIDAFLAARQVGSEGRIIGVDMTPEMIDRARASQARGDYSNVEFRLGEIENLPVANNEVDLIISNCVINLVGDKKRAFAEAFRILKPGGRLMISDIVVTKPLPPAVADSVALYTGCIAGAEIKEEYLEMIQNAGFEKVEVISEKHFPAEFLLNDPTVQKFIAEQSYTMEQLQEIATTVVSVNVRALKSNR